MYIDFQLKGIVNFDQDVPSQHVKYIFICIFAFNSSCEGFLIIVSNTQPKYITRLIIIAEKTQNL